MKRLILILCLVFCPPVPAQETPVIDDATREISRKVILNIYRDILAVKDQHPELAGFDEDCLYENRRGIYAIVYKQKDFDMEKQRDPADFGITIDAMADETFPGRPANLNFGFPLIGVKFAGYQPLYLPQGRFDLLKFINRRGIDLSLHEQKYLPLRLGIRPLKENFRIGEPIEFEVSLENASAANIYVKKLDWNSLYFLIGERPWGTPPDKKNQAGERVVLRAGEKLKARFKGSTFSSPKEMDVHAAYNLKVKGVSLFATTKIRIRE